MSPIHTITEIERATCDSFKRLEEINSDPLFLDLVRAYAANYAEYRMGKVAADMYREGSFDGARKIMAKISE